MITKEDAVNAKIGDVFYHKNKLGSTKLPIKCRVTGKCKTWKTRLLEYRLPVRFGLRSNFYIDNTNAHEWRKEEYNNEVTEAAERE